MEHDCNAPPSEPASVAPMPGIVLSPWHAEQGVPAPDHWMQELGTLLAQLQEGCAAPASAPAVDLQPDNRLAQVRLGVASALFVALRCRHAAHAGQALRVALTVSAWALHMRLPAAERDRLEVAALLHSVGDLSVPDRVLLKPGTLDAEEAAVMGRARSATLEILRACTADAALLSIVEHTPAWFDGTRETQGLSGEEIPRGARMIAIADAHVAMTSDHVYRSAMTPERAMTELFEHAGSQFCPLLVSRFAEFQLCNQTALRAEVAARWLGRLDAEEVNRYWRLTDTPLASGGGRESVFQAMLVRGMRDAVIFVDGSLRILFWNSGAERLTGIGGGGVRDERWTPALLNLRDERDRRVDESDCPLTAAIRSGVQAFRRMTVISRHGRSVVVDVHALPVPGEQGAAAGGILVLHDASSETSLEERCENLQLLAKRDPLTQVANRAEFDRSLVQFVRTHQQRQTPCSLIICDLDRFKRVNDTYGHQAGDEAIKALAVLLKSASGPGDLAARYGGEEFVLLCANCDNAAAARRAEDIRQQLAQTPLAALAGQPITASFGVTEIQPGDTPETMLRRADRGLLMAKTQGRNRVVQLGGGAVDEPVRKRSGTLLQWIGGGETPRDPVLHQTLVTAVPVRMAVEKLRGFLADHAARVVSIHENQIELEIDERTAVPMRRGNDRPMTFALELRFEEEQAAGASVSRTRIQVALHVRKNRDRRRADVANRAGEVLASFRSYLMASTVDPNQKEGAMRRVKQLIAPWLS